MRMWLICLLLSTGMIFVSAQQIQQIEQEEIPVPETKRFYVRATVYPTASLSRYDFNNDIDLFELRVYVNLHEGNSEGEFIDQAKVWLNGELLNHTNNTYEKRIRLQNKELVKEVELKINIGDGRKLTSKMKIPTWLIIKQPEPGIIDNASDLNVNWIFSEANVPVDIRIYDFRSGDEIWKDLHQMDIKTLVQKDKLPNSTILRIYAMTSWIFKRYITGRDVVQGSEFNIIPWSQVFLRINQK